MCTRFYVDKEDPTLLPIIREMERSPLYKTHAYRIGLVLASSCEVKPTDSAPVIAPDRDGKRAVFPMRFGMRMVDRTLVLNVRSETASSLPFFQNDWNRHRCIIPSSYYIEYDHRQLQGGKKTADKYAVQPAGATVTWMCGLYRIENGIPYFVILTREPSEDFRKIHDRMPLILPENCINDWIEPRKDPSALLQAALTDMVFEKIC